MTSTINPIAAAIILNDNNNNNNNILENTMTNPQPQRTSPEQCLSHRVLTFLGNKTQSGLKFTAEKVAAPVEQYMRDDAAPAALHYTAVATGKTGNWLNAIAKKAEEKSASMRKPSTGNPVVDQLNKLSKAELVALIASQVN